jgi:hypothetical protein
MKSRKNQQLLACFLNRNSNSYGHTNRGVVTSADQTHHLYSLVNFEKASAWEALQEVLLYKT